MRRTYSPTHGIPAVLLAAAALVGGCDRGAATRPPATPAAKPNILFVVWDTVRVDYLSLYGYERKTTPHLDRFADQSRVFEDCLSVASTTVPSHSSMFTGLHPTEHGASNSLPVLPDKFKTLAEHLKAAGYDTYMFAENPYIGRTKENASFGQGFDLVEHPWSPRYYEDAVRITKSKLHPEDRSNALPAKLLEDSASKGPKQEWNIKACGELAQQGVENWLEQRDADRPYFIFLNYMEAHRPLLPSREYRAQMMTPEQIEASYRVDRSWLSTWSYVVGLREYTPKEIVLTRATYAAALLELDTLFHDLLESLRARGALENTCVVLTADHGEHLGEHHRLDHQYSVYEPVIRVPLVIHYPPRFAPGRDERPVMNFDLFPTLLELAGIPSPGQARGVALQRPLAERARLAEYLRPLKGPLRLIRKRYPRFDQTPWLRSLRAYYDAPHKFIWVSDGRHELYNLMEDPGELRNLIKEQPQTAIRLAADSKSYLDDLKKAQTGAQAIVDKATLHRLEQLGYAPDTADQDDESTPDNDAP